MAILSTYIAQNNINVSCLKLDIAFADTIDDREYWSDDFSAENNQYHFARLKLIKAFDTERLSLSYLLRYGLNGAPQSALRAADSLRPYLDNVVEITPSIYEIIPIPEELDDNKAKAYIEGAKKQATVNSYGPR